jgi:hypothetical protein
VDLNVKPKKTEVWVDGQYVGRSGKFDGFPGYLWLGKGTHEVIFYKPGFETSVHKIKVLEGVVLDFEFVLAPGEATPPQELTRYRGERRAATPRERDRRPEGGEVDRESRGRDVRPEPGRLLLEIEPGDASVYLDGRFLGTSDELSRLHAGLIVEEGGHTLEVVRPGYESERMEFSISPGEETRIEIDLDRS